MKFIQESSTGSLSVNVAVGAKKMVICSCNMTQIKEKCKSNKLHNFVCIKQQLILKPSSILFNVD